MENSTTKERSKFSLWMQAFRPFSLTATLVPVLLGAMITLAFYNGEVNWWLMIVIALGSPLFQISGNLLSEYFDFKKKVDRPDTFGSSRVLVDGLMKPKSVLSGGIIALTVLFALGMILVYFRGIDMLVIGLIGIIGSYIYSAMKYKALGDLHIFLFFGPVMMFGTNYALTGSYELLKEIAILSLPVAMLVTAILHANNTRDIKHDGEAGIITFASVIGIKAARMDYYILLIGSYLAVVAFVLAGLVEAWALLVFLSLPIAIKNIKVMMNADVEKPKNIFMLDIMTAQLHMVFGVLFSISILLQEIV